MALPIFDTRIDPAHFSPALMRLQETPPKPLANTILWTLLALLAILLVWVLLGRLDITAVAQGKLVPETQIKIVQPADSGIIQEILVKEGQAVRAGQVLMRMDTHLSEADGKALDAEYQRQRLTLRRIEAELAATPFRQQPDDPAPLAQEIAAQYRANRAAVQANLDEEHARLAKARQELNAARQIRDKLEQSLPHYREQEQAYRKLVAEGFAGALMASDKQRERMEKEQELQTQHFLLESARASILQSERRLQQITSDYHRQLHAERQQAQAQHDRLAQEISKQRHRQEWLELKAPQDGIVKDISTHTTGTVVQPGAVLLTLVPQGEILHAEVWVNNADIGFVRHGQEVKLKFASYPFQKYGMASGTVAHVSADASDARNGAGSTAPASAPSEPALAYKARISLHDTHLEMHGERFELSAGMQTSAEIKLGDRSVAEYLLSPVRKAWHEAARER